VIALLANRWLVGAVAALVIVTGAYLKGRHDGKYAERTRTSVAAVKADERYQKARRARGEPLYRDLLNYRPAPETLIVRVPAQVTHEGETPACFDRSDEFWRLYNDIADGKSPPAP
jgi:hypothetical protein